MFGTMAVYGFGGQKMFWTVNLTLETKIKVTIFILCGIPPNQLTTFQLYFLCSNV